MNTEKPTSSTSDAADSGPPALRYASSEHAEALWDSDLDASQVGWRPDSAEDLWRQALPWRCERMTVELDGEIAEVVELTNSAEPSWDWRTVSFWVAALGPGWRYTSGTRAGSTSSGPECGARSAECRVGGRGRAS